MAEALLKAWDAPALVASVEINAPGKRVAHAENAKVSSVGGGTSLTWNETDGALPMPLNLEDKVVALSINSSDFIETLDQEPLRVTGLPAGRYTLKINGEKVGDFTNAQLQDGFNLATLPTPMAKQASEVYDLTRKHNDIHFARWRNVQVPLQDLKLAAEPAALAALDKLEEQLVQQQRTAAQPKTRHYELAPE